MPKTVPRNFICLKENKIYSMLFYDNSFFPAILYLLFLNIWHVYYLNMSLCYPVLFFSFLFSSFLFFSFWLVGCLVGFIYVFFLSLEMKFRWPCLHGKHFTYWQLFPPAPYLLLLDQMYLLLNLIDWYKWYLEFLIYLSAIGQNSEWTGEASMSAPVTCCHFSE